MIIQEVNGNTVRSYSDRGVYIHGGFPEGDYIDAVDPVGANRTYVETDIEIPTTDEDKAEAYDILMGMSE